MPVAQRRAKAAREVEKRRKSGQTVAPVVIEGRTIAHTFWGKAWCDNLESYSDYENRLPRGRTYVRNGSVVDLQIQPGKITALVSGSELYKVAITITPLPDKAWRDIKSRCAGQIGSLVELLAGRLSKNVIAIVTAHDGGLFPKPSEIEMSCSCPDWAGMCKHVAAVMYGVGARLDHKPELLFSLRKVDHRELIEGSRLRRAPARRPRPRKKTLAEAEVAGVFGIELAESEASDPRQPRQGGLRRDRPSPASRSRSRESLRPCQNRPARDVRHGRPRKAGMDNGAPARARLIDCAWSQIYWSICSRACFAAPFNSGSSSFSEALRASSTSFLRATLPMCPSARAAR